MRRHKRGNRYTVEYVAITAQPDLVRVTAEPTKTVYINTAAAPWAAVEKVIKNADDPLLLKLAKGA